MEKIKTISIIMVDGKVKGIKSPVLIELRNRDMGFLPFTENEMDEARKNGLALIEIKNNICSALTLPEELQLEVIEDGKVA
jgi:hypothetical protein